MFFSKKKEFRTWNFFERYFFVNKIMTVANWNVIKPNLVIKSFHTYSCFYLTFTFKNVSERFKSNRNKNFLTIIHDNHLSLSIPDHHKIIYEVVVCGLCRLYKMQSVKIIYSILKIACNWQLVEMHFGRYRYSCVFAAFFQIYFHLNAIYFFFFIQ